MRKPPTTRRLGAEALELRQLLCSHTDWDAADGSAAQAACQEMQAAAPLETATTTITRLSLRINGVLHDVGSHQQLSLQAGDQIQVAEVSFESTLTGGIFALEAYVHKLGDQDGASELDVTDGRFSAREVNVASTGGPGTIAGVSDTWTVEDGWARLTVNLVHYTADAPVQIAARHALRLQVGTPDFAFDLDYQRAVAEARYALGDSVTIPGRWSNQGEGAFHNYAEVDIYHASDLHTIVWAGALVGNARADGQGVMGEYRNLREDDDFSERFTPTDEGEYLLRYYLDPEYVTLESDESNNRDDVTIRVGAGDDDDLVAEDIHVRPGDRIQVVSDAAIIEDTEVLYYEDFEDPATFAGVVNPHGSDTARTGRWTVAGPVERTSYRGVDLQVGPDGSTGALVTGNELALEDQFSPVNWIRVTDFAISSDSLELTVRNQHRGALDDWAIVLWGANFDIPRDALQASTSLETFKVDHGDGTFDHYVLGTEPLASRASLTITWHDPQFDDTPDLEDIEGGVLVPGSVGANDIDGGVTSVRTPSVTLPEVDQARLSLRYNFAHLANATSDDFLRFSVVGEHGSRVVWEERGTGTVRPAAWQTLEVDLSDFMGESVYLLVEAADHGSPSLVEAGVDDLRITATTIRLPQVATFTQPDHGIVYLDADRRAFEYVPDEGFAGVDRFTYVLTDGESFSDPATVHIGV